MYRASQQASTKQSPYFIPTRSQSISARIDQLLQSREEAFKEAEANIAIAQKKQNEDI